MAYAFTDWEGTCLAHHGIKGQKWGVRRFQNPDGTLTEAGKKRVAKSGAYMDPNFKQRFVRIHERGEVRAAHDEEWNQHHDSMYIRPHVPNYKNRKVLWDKYKDQYAKATLKDLKLRDSRKARNAIKAVLKDIDPDYKMRPYEYTMSDSQRQKYAERKKELLHPKRTKLKKALKKLGKAADRAHQISETAVNTRKIIKG